MTAFREIVDEHGFLKKLEKLGVSAKRLDELLESLQLHLARRPELFPNVPGTTLHRVVVNPFPGLRHLNLWFTYDDKTVTFVEVDEIEL